MYRCTGQILEPPSPGGHRNRSMAPCRDGVVAWIPWEKPCHATLGRDGKRANAQGTPYGNQPPGCNKTKRDAKPHCLSAVTHCSGPLYPSTEKWFPPQNLCGGRLTRFLVTPSAAPVRDTPSAPAPMLIRRKLLMAAWCVTQRGSTEASPLLLLRCNRSTPAKASGEIGIRPSGPRGSGVPWFSTFLQGGRRCRSGKCQLGRQMSLHARDRWTAIMAKIGLHLSRIASSFQRTWSSATSSAACYLKVV
jgi:hypothetical protein